jgi:PAS domain S-box-containing protein
MLVALDAAGSITLLNRRACQVLGIAEREALGRNWFDSYVPERNRAQVRATFAALIEGNLEPVEYYENPVLTAGGEERLIVWHNAILRDQQGRPTGTLSSGEDVTERERALKALRESEEKYRSVVERASDGICVVQGGQLKYVNHRLAEMAGYAVADLIGKQFLGYLHPEDRAGVSDRYRRRLAGESIPSTYTVRFLRRDGSVMTVEVNAATAMYGGAPADIVLLRDVSERERTAKVLRESEERYRELVESSPDGIAVYQNGVVVLANRATAALLGYRDPSELVGMQAGSLVSPDDLPRVEEREELLRSGTAAGPLMVRFLTRTGGTVPTEVVGAITTWHGKPAVQVMVRPLSGRPV